MALAIFLAAMLPMVSWGQQVDPNAQWSQPQSQGVSQGVNHFPSDFQQANQQQLPNIGQNIAPSGVDLSQDTFSRRRSGAPQALPADINNPYLQRRHPKLAPGNRPRSSRQRGGRTRGEALPQQSGADTNYYVNIGTTPGSKDVMTGDHTSDPYNAFIKPPDMLAFVAKDVPFNSFYVSKDAVVDAPDQVMIQEPVATSYDTEIADVVVLSNWPNPVMNVPESTVSALHFAVQYSCKKEGKVMVVVQSRLFGTSTASGGKQTRKEIQFFFTKECAAPEMVEVSTGGKGSTTAPRRPSDKALPGFNVGSKEGSQNIMKDGIPMKGWGLTDPAGERFIVKEDSDFFYMFLSFSDDLMQKEPKILLLPSDPNIAEAAITTGSIKTKMTRANIKFECRNSGTTDFTVVFQFGRARTAFALTKKCPAPSISEDGEKERPSGVLFPGLNIGSKDGESNFVENGIVAKDFQTTRDVSFEETKARHTYKEATTVVKFYVEYKGTGDVPLIKRPQAVQVRVGDDKDKPILHPKIEVEKDDLEAFGKKKKFTATLRFNCFRKGTVNVLVAFPTAQGSVEIVIRKACAKGKETKDDRVPIPGFNVGLQANTANVVSNGLALSAFNLDDKSGNIYTVEDDLYLTFFVWIDDEAEEDSLTYVNFTAPELISTVDSTEALLSGPGSDGALLDENHIATRISITFHCNPELVGVDMTFTIVLPMVNYEGSGITGPQMLEDVRFSFVKRCPSDPDMLLKPQTTGLGGVGITGFAVGTDKDKHDVVYNGFPQGKYFGQRQRKTPAWSDIMVPASEMSTKLYLTYKVPSDKSESSVGQSVALSVPSVISHSNCASAELSGAAADGGVLVLNSDSESSLELDITYKCYYQGVAAITIMMPVVPHGVITFTIPKQCDGPVAPAGRQISGLFVGTTEGGMEVIRDGFTQEAFKAFELSDKSFTSKFEDTTLTFFITKSGRPIGGLEPMILAHRPYCNPQIEHSMHVDATDSKNIKEDMDKIIINDKPNKLTITFNCILEAVTPVTLTIPLSGGQRITWTWAHDCRGEEENLGMPENMEWEYEGPDDPYFKYEFDIPSENGYAKESFDEYEGMYPDDEGYSPLSFEQCEGCIGTLSIGTDHDMLNDVVNRGIAQPMYSIPPAGEEKPLYTIIDRKTQLVNFWVSAPASFNGGDHQEFLPPTVTAYPTKEGKQVCVPTLDGDAAAGGDVTTLGSPLRLQLKFNCKEGMTGVTPVVVTIQLKPGFVSFRLIKVCGKFEVVEAFYWTANRILILIGVLLAIGLVFTIFCLAKHFQTDGPAYSKVSTSDMEMVAARKSQKPHVMHGIEVIEANPDDSD